ALSGTTSTQTTTAPSSANPPAMPPPMFGLVPVTIAIFPANRAIASPRSRAESIGAGPVKVSRATRPSSDVSAEPERSGQQRAGQRDAHDDARDDHRLLELPLRDVVELQD